MNKIYHMKKIIRNDYSTNISVFEVEISDEDVLLFTEDRDKFFNEVVPNLKFNFIKNNVSDVESEYTLL